MECMLWLGDIGQWQDASTKVFTHLTWFVRIWQLISDYDLQQHLRHAHIACGLYASAE